MLRFPNYTIGDAIHVNLNPEASLIRIQRYPGEARDFDVIVQSPRLDVLAARELHRRHPDGNGIVNYYASSTTAGRELMRAERLMYVTEEQNLFLVDENDLYIWIEQPQKRRPASKKEGGQLSLGKRDLQVLFVLLVYPMVASESQTEIANLAGVSQATASRAIRSLEAHARTSITSNDWRGMREEYSVYWAERYLEKLRPKLATQRYRHLGSESAALQLAVDYERSGAAALLYKGELLANADIIELYGPPHDFEALRRAHLFPDAEGNVIVRDRFWRGKPALVVPELLIYADLIATGDPRDHEAARVVLEQFVSNK